MAFQQSLSSGQKTTHFCHYWQILVKNHCRYIAGDIKAFYIIFCFDFLHIDPRNEFCFYKFLRKVSKEKERGWKLNFLWFRVRFLQTSKKGGKTFNPTILWLFLTFYLWRLMWVYLKSSKQENFEKIFEKRSRMRICKSVVQIRGSGSVPNVTDPQHHFQH